jgi:hypothetical protein
VGPKAGLDGCGKSRPIGIRSAYPRFGTTYRHHIQSKKVQEEIIGYPETSVRNYHCALRKISDERRYYFDSFGRKKHHQICNQQYDPKP